MELCTKQHFCVKNQEKLQIFDIFVEKSGGKWRKSCIFEAEFTY